jgi:hypothetical protein
MPTEGIWMRVGGGIFGRGVGVGSGVGLGTMGSLSNRSANGVAVGVGDAAACSGGGGVAIVAIWLGGVSGDGRSATVPIAAIASKTSPVRMRSVPSRET